MFSVNGARWGIHISLIVALLAIAAGAIYQATARATADARFQQKPTTDWVR